MLDSKLTAKLQNFKMKAGYRGRGRGRGRFNGGYSRGSGGFRGRGGQNTSPQTPDLSETMATLAALMQQQQGSAGGVTNMGKTNVMAQKLTSRCTRCNQPG
jgi:hypothetical protein